MHLVIIGGSDGGISAGLRARELNPSVEVTVVVADAYPNFSICGLPYWLSGDVPDWRALAHRTISDLEQTGMRLLLDHTARAIDPAAKHVTVTERIDAAALFHGMAVEELNDLNLSYTPPFGSPWDTLQLGAQAWVRAATPTR